MIEGVEVKFEIDIGTEYDSSITVIVHLREMLDEFPGELTISNRIPFNPHDNSHGLDVVENVRRNHPLALFSLCESPAEVAFYLFAWQKIKNLRPQVEVGQYRVDFAVADKKIAIEIDGHQYHKTQEQRTRDAKRERYLQLNGWRVIRFTALEVFQDKWECVEQTLGLMDVFDRRSD